MKILNNFLVVSNYNNDISWVVDYTDNYLIYDKSDNGKELGNIDPDKVIKSPNVGYNIYEYLDFIVNNYNNLPDCTIFVKGNIFPRHISREFFERLANNNYFTPIVDYHLQSTSFPIWLYASDGGFLELNNNRYLSGYDLKYLSSYNDLMSLCFKEPVLPKYVHFAPGANYIVPRENILKLPKIVYENLKVFVSYCQLPGEAHILERSLQTLWTCNFEINDKILEPIDESFALSVSKKASWTIGRIMPSWIKKIIKFFYKQTEKLDKYV